jgi:predicted TIM-barrel fold metal-dependent hydrolase
MIIDSHTHLGRNNHILANADELLASMDQAKIDRALVYAGEINDCSNKWLMEQTKNHRDRLLPVASVSLEKVPIAYGMTGTNTDDMSVWDMLETIHQGAVAIKLYTGYEHFSPNSPIVNNVLHYAEREKKPVIFHTGDCLSSVKHAKLKYAQPLDIDEVAVDHPNLNIIIAHMGYPWFHTAAEVCYKNKNVFSDMSGFVYGSFEGLDSVKFKHAVNEFIDIAGTDKLLFGTDWPISNQKSYVDTLDDLYGETLTVQYLSRNTERAFNL